MPSRVFYRHRAGGLAHPLLPRAAASLHTRAYTEWELCPEISSTGLVCVPQTQGPGVSSQLTLGFSRVASPAPGTERPTCCFLFSSSPRQRWKPGCTTLAVGARLGVLEGLWIRLRASGHQPHVGATEPKNTLPMDAWRRGCRGMEARLSPHPHSVFQSKRRTSSSSLCPSLARRGTLKPPHMKKETRGSKLSRARSWPASSRVKAARIR